MNSSGVVKGIDCDEIHVSEFYSGDRSSSELEKKPETLLQQEISSETDDHYMKECDGVLKSQLGSVPKSELSDVGESLQSTENDSLYDDVCKSALGDYSESLPPTEHELPPEDVSKSELGSLPTSDLSDIDESLKSGENTLPVECVEKSLPTDCGKTPSEEKLHSSLELSNGIVEDIKERLDQGLSKHECKAKRKKIMLALANNDKDYLASAARSPGGLLDDNIRRKVWPKLVNVDVVITSPRPCQEEIEHHPYYQQVLLDVNRSLKRFPPSIKEVQRLTMLDQLVILIMRVLCKHPELHYYQGYHDICVTFLLVLGEETAYHVLEKLSRSHLSVFMEKSMEPTIHLLEHMYLLIGKHNPQYQEFLLRSEVGVAYCLSWLITWFSHVLNDYSTVVRFFDFFIVSHRWMPMYVTASLVLHREPGAMKQDCDMASVHSFLCKIPDDLPFEDLLTESLNLFENVRPIYLARKRPYIKAVKHGRINKWDYIKRMKYPATLVIAAAAVLVTAVIYQAYRY